MRRRAFRGRISKSRAWGNLVQFVHSLAHLKLEAGSGHFNHRSEQPQPQPRLQPRGPQPSSTSTSTSTSTMASVGRLPTGNLTGAGKSSPCSLPFLKYPAVAQSAVLTMHYATAKLDAVSRLLDKLTVDLDDKGLTTERQCWFLTSPAPIRPFY